MPTASSGIHEGYSQLTERQVAEVDRLMHSRPEELPIELLGRLAGVRGPVTVPIIVDYVREQAAEPADGGVDAAG